MPVEPVLVDVTGKVSVDAPFTLYQALRRRGYSYLLESVEKSGQKARFSFVGAAPSALVTVKGERLRVELMGEARAAGHFMAERLETVADMSREGSALEGTIRHGRDLFDALRAAIPAAPCRDPNSFGRQVFYGGAIGYLAYDLVLSRLGRPSTSTVPDAQMAVVESTFIFDHLMRKVYFALSPLLPGPKVDLIQDIEGIDPEPIHQSRPAEFLGAGGQEEYMDAVRAAQEHIAAGDIFQVVLARSARFGRVRPLDLYLRLRTINPSPYTYLFEFGDLAIVGASPETLFSAYAGRLQVNPIAGTCPRGRTIHEDRALAEAMLGDEKERAEHVMLVDLGRNDVRQVCQSGSVQVEDFMSVLQYSHVQHIETTVSGRLRPECDQFDAARAVFPAGTLSGAPKMRAMEIIDRLEAEPRGIYGGGIGYFSADGSVDFAIAIRSILISNGIARVQAGAGIVADSDPIREFAETERKMAAMQKALGAA